MPRSYRCAAAGLAITALLSLAGCQTPEAACRKAYPADAAAYERCWQAVLTQQNQELNREYVRELRARGGG